ncbi:MAG: hypothetical protein ABIA21_04125 [Candidatus Aenigmatarchaeota archaeon]
MIINNKNYVSRVLVALITACREISKLYTNFVYVSPIETGASTNSSAVLGPGEFKRYSGDE